MIGGIKMDYNGVDIYACKFFTLNEEKKLQFYCGGFKGKTADDFRTIPELQKVIAYCFWLLSKEDIPPVTKYTASAFFKSLTPKISEMERVIRKRTIDEQTQLKEKTEQLTKTTGKKYA